MAKLSHILTFGSDPTWEPLVEGLEQSCCCCCWGMGSALCTSLGLGSPDFILEATRRSGIFFCLPSNSGPNGLPASPPPGPSPGLGAAHQQEVLEEALLPDGEMLLYECRRCRTLQFFNSLFVESRFRRKVCK